MLQTLFSDPGSDRDKRDARRQLGPPLRLFTPRQVGLLAHEGGLSRQAQQLTLHEATHGKD